MSSWDPSAVSKELREFAEGAKTEFSALFEAVGKLETPQKPEHFKGLMEVHEKAVELRDKLAESIKRIEQTVRLNGLPWSGEDAGTLHETLALAGRVIEALDVLASSSAEGAKVAIPSDTSLPILFGAGVPLPERLARFGVMRNEDADGNLEAVSFELRTLKDGSVQELTLFDPDFFEERIPKTGLSPEAWRSEALALLPKVLGPEKLALYYATWHGIDADGDFPFHPVPFLELFGMNPDDTRNRRALEAQLRLLTRVELKIERKYGPGAGTLESASSTFRLIEETKEKLNLRFRDHPRLEKLSFFRHPKTMREIQRAFHVKVPRDAFGLVGRWTPGRGSNDAGIRALALTTTSYVLARAYAGKEGKQGDLTFHGAVGFEMPLEEIAVMSGFTTPEKFKKDPGRVADRVAEAVERLALEFKFLGPGSEVKRGRFRFEAPEALRGDLLPIAEKAKLMPKRPPAIDVPSTAKKAGKRGRRRRAAR